MKIKCIELPETWNEAWLIGISDVHLGDPSLDKTLLNDKIKQIENTQNARIILNGDILNAAIKSSVSDIYSEEIPPEKQLEVATTIFEPIKDKIIAIITGNHERRIYKDVGINILKLLADKLGCYYAGDETYLKITLGKNSHSKRIAYNVYATHGNSNGRTAGAKINALNRLNEIVLADLYFVSHTHFPITFKDSYVIPDPRNNNLIEIERTYINTSAFLNRGGYTVVKNYPHVSQSLPRARLDGHEKHVEVVI